MEVSRQPHAPATLPAWMETAVPPEEKKVGGPRSRSQRFWEKE